MQEVKHFFVHVIHHLLVLGNLKELSNFLMGLVVRVTKIDLQFLLQLLVRLILFKSPRLYITLLVPKGLVRCLKFVVFLEECWFLGLYLTFFNRVSLLECLVGSLLLIHFLFIHIQIAKVD